MHMASGLNKTASVNDRLYFIAEGLAQDFSLFPSLETGQSRSMRGLLQETEIARRRDVLANMDIDSYIEAVVSDAEDTRRTPAPDVIRRLGERFGDELRDGPFYACVVRMDFDGMQRPVAFIAQDRSVNNGVWGPEHHIAAADWVAESANRAMPIVTFMDTPGADAQAEANRNNQAHSISRLITQMAGVKVPNIGIIFGLGYSGGAIPLAASNLLLSVRDGVFSTIQPQGLASIARRLNLSWQQCAKQVGLSPFELYDQGNIDGVIDYSPGEADTLENLRLAIVSGIQSIEATTTSFVADNPYILDHYRRSLERYLAPSERLRRIQESGAFSVSRNPTEYPNVFGVANRYLRYLRCRRRIKATSEQQYGRLAQQRLPEGELAARAARERRRVFLKWMQDPDQVRYDDVLSRAWKNYVSRKEALGDERGRFARLILGEPAKNYREARATLLSDAGMYLFNRWKTDATGNFAALKHYLTNHTEVRALVGVNEIREPRALLRTIARDPAFGPLLRQRFTHEGGKLLSPEHLDGKSDAYVRSQLAAELNLAMTEGPMDDLVVAAELAQRTRQAMSEGGKSTAHLVVNRMILEDRFPSFIMSAANEAQGGGEADEAERTVLDILLEDDLREDFASECENFLLFDAVYDHTIASLDSIAEEAGRTRSLSKASLSGLIDLAFAAAAKGAARGTPADEPPEQVALRLKGQFFDWYRRIADNSRSGDFFRAVEEWKKRAFAHLPDTLLVVVTFLFERLLLSYLRSEWDGRRYDGRIAPRKIGRKDFWNRLHIAYRDLRIQNTLAHFKSRRATAPQAFIDMFFSDFEELFADLLSSDPCEFPGLRQSIETALASNTTPCGVITGIGTFKDGNGGLRAGAVISNANFQAGAFDMASAEKFCKLLVACAEQNLPVICFISSGGMQTKEGAGSLFSMAAINDRVTRFVRDYDLPVIMFGFGDCTGGAQASFVTHPLAQTYYFSGASMPFAGQIVVPSNLPMDSILSNYLCDTPGSMQGLVKHPMLPDLDDELRKIDPDIPVPVESATDVVNRVMAGVLSQQRPVTAPSRPTVRPEDLIRPVSKVLIHARGCTAVKLIRIAQRRGIGVVLVQSDPDMESVPVDMLSAKDSVVCIGGATPDESYLNALSVISVAEHEGVDALHPGIGFLSESSQFAEVVRSRGINFIGPSTVTMDIMGNKSNAITTAMRLGVPVVPGSHGIVTEVDRAAALADEISYPILIKAVHGGGGKGIQVVESRDRFHELFQRVSTEARAAFGNGDVYLEKYITSLRHIEAQVLRDYHGNTRVLGLRDCSVQRDKQKVIEESGSTMLPEDLERTVREHAAALADEVKYVGAGTVEFIYDLDAGAVYFMEMNTRLQVEHPVTEMVSGVDIVGEQFRIAAGESIADLEVGENGYAIEARINAERIASSDHSFQPSPGTITACEFPSARDVDVISIAAPDRFISPYYDSMIGQVIAHGRDRADTAAKLAKYLDRVRMEGIATNIALVKRVLRDPTFLKGNYDTGYLPAFLAGTESDVLIEEIERAAGPRPGDIGSDAIRIENSVELRVLSPSAGIFFANPSPAEPEYVQPGQRIGLDDILCQLEAFKIFTPLRLEDYNSGDNGLYREGEYEVTHVNVTSGQQVNAGDLLFVVKPTQAAEAG